LVDTIGRSIPGVNAFVKAFPSTRDVEDSMRYRLGAPRDASTAR
jgi:hypothetical protein